MNNFIRNFKNFKMNEEVNQNIWISVDHSPAVSFEEFYDVNTADDVDQLSPEEFDQIKNMEIGEVLEFGMGVDVKRVSEEGGN